MDFLVEGCISQGSYFTTLQDEPVGVRRATLQDSLVKTSTLSTKGLTLTIVLRLPCGMRTALD